MNFYKNEEGDVIFAMTEKVFAERVKNVSEEKRAKYTDIDEAVDIWECMDFAKFFDTIYAEFVVDNEYMNEDFLVAIEGSCELKLEEENFYLTTITDVKPYVFLRQQEVYLTLDQWRDRVDNNGDLNEDVRETIYLLIDGVNQSVRKDYIEKNIIHHMPVWDKVSAMKLK